MRSGVDHAKLSTEAGTYNVRFKVYSHKLHLLLTSPASAMVTLSSLSTLEKADRENGHSSRSKLLHANCPMSHIVSNGLNTPIK